MPGEPSVTRPYRRIHKDELDRLQHGRHALGDALLVLLLDPAIRSHLDPMAIRQAERALEEYGGSHARQALIAYRLRQVESKAAAAAEPEPTYRYRVIRTWGGVSPSIAEMTGKDEAYLVYPAYLGKHHSETVVDLRTGHALGGFSMEYAGRREPPPAQTPE